MAVFNLRRLNENLSKRVPVAANFKILGKVPGGKLEAGSHLIGRIEGDVVITRVTSVIADGFGGVSPTATYTDSDGLIYFTDRDLAVEGAVGSQLTNPDGVGRPAPIYKEGVTEFYVDYNGDSWVGEACLVVEYVNLDTKSGLHNGGIY